MDASHTRTQTPLSRSDNRRPKILIIEPHTATRNVLMQLFVDYDVSVATDGVQAAEHANAVRPDCVIMEVSLAQHSGIEFLYEFRSYVDWQSIPVVVFTSLQIPQTVLRSVSWGLLDIEYAYKPHTSLDQLSTLVQGLVSDTQYISSEVAG